MHNTPFIYTGKYLCFVDICIYDDGVVDDDDDGDDDDDDHKHICYY
jgi:hypothetical protein